MTLNIIDTDRERKEMRYSKKILYQSILSNKYFELYESL